MAVIRKQSKQDIHLLTKKQIKTINAMVELGQEAPEDIHNALVSRALILCPLPYRKVKETQLTRITKLPHGVLNVTFSDMSNGKGLPYGDDALVLDLLASEARKRKDRVISFHTAKELLEFIGMTPYNQNEFGGQDFKRTLQRIDRLRRLGIAVVWDTDNGTSVDLYRVFSKSLSPSISDVDREKLGERGLFPYFLEFSEEFFDEIMHKYRSIPREVLLQFNGSPTEYALAKFIVDRVMTARSVSVIPMEFLRSERGSCDSNLRRFQAKLRAVLIKLSAWNPDYHPDHGTLARITPKGLRIGPEKEALRDPARVEKPVE